MTYLLIAAAAYVALCLWVRARESSMLYYPARVLDATPDGVGLPYRDVTLTTSDGVTIHGWFIPQKSSFTILFLHGNAGNISHRLDKLTLFHQLGVNTLIIDYRGYGRSEGKPGENGTYLDAETAVKHLGATEKIILYGESLGTAVAVEMATRHRFAGVILEEPFTSVADVGRGMFPFLPVRLLARNKYDSLSKIDRLNAPLLILHSRNDEVFPFRHAQRLFAAAREPKQLVELRGGHNDAFLVSADTYRAALQTFLRELDASAPNR